MVAVIRKNPWNGETPVVPLQEDGSNFEYMMYFNGHERIAYANTIREMIEVLVPQYLGSDEASQQRMRTSYATSVAVWTQALILAEIADTDLSDEERSIVYAKRNEKPQPVIRDWSSDVPVVVVEDNYEPYTTTPKPTSTQGALGEAENIIFMRTHSEKDFLYSLHEAGYIRLLQSCQ